jgi:prolipoprotein diacylglyceryltransferase
MRQIIIDFGTIELFGTTISPSVYGYGLMLVLGFLTGIYLAQWRARRNGEDPEHCPQVGILALIGGVLGARIAYIIENADVYFPPGGPADWAGMLNITSGGLIYFGGVILATVLVLGYLRLKGLPIRRFLDILAVSMMIGLAFGRAGCYLNGCCYGGACSEEWALASHFPMYSEPLVNLGDGNSPFSQGMESPSPPYAAQLREGRVKVDPRLVNPLAGPRVVDHEGRRVTIPVLTPPGMFHGRLTADQVEPYQLPLPDLQKAFVRIAGDDRLISRAEWEQAARKADGVLRGSETWDQAMLLDGVQTHQRDEQITLPEFKAFYGQRRAWMLASFDTDNDGRLGPEEAASANDFLQASQYAIAHEAHAEPVQPAQLLGLINALLIAGILSGFYRLRWREGQVFVLMLILYPISRFVLESIRADNPHDITRGVLTHNQVTSMILLAVGLLAWWGLTKLPASAGPPAAQRQAGKAN